MKPVKVGQVVEVAIVDLTSKGEGIGKIDRFPIFIEKALPEEHVTAKITAVKKNFAFGKLIDVHKTSPERVRSHTENSYDHGACDLLHLSYEGQLKFKTNLVKETLRRVGKIEVDVDPCLGMEHPWNYRNKSAIPFGLRDGQVVCGLFAPGTHDIIDMNESVIDNLTTIDIMKYIKNTIMDYGIIPYDEVTHSGMLRHVVIRHGEQTNEYMVTLVVRTNDIPKLNEFLENLTTKFREIVSVVLNINPQRTNRILGNEEEVLYGTPYIHDFIGDVKFKISSKSFYQVNPKQTKVLYDIVKQFANLAGDETIIDAYCGIGTIGLYLAKNAKAIYGIEVVKEAIDDAKMNAKLNGYENAYFEVGKAEDVIRKWKEKGIQADVLVVDPPRKGCDQTFIDTIIEMEIPRVIYVSCNPSTLARDLNILKEKYNIEKVQPVDMFPHTSHVETVVLMSRK